MPALRRAWWLAGGVWAWGTLAWAQPYYAPPAAPAPVAMESPAAATPAAGPLAAEAAPAGEPRRFDAAVVPAAAHVPLPAPEVGLPAEPRGPRLPARPAETAAAPRSAEDRGRPLASSSHLLSTLTSLALVTGLFLGLAWVVRRGLPRSHAPLPLEVVEVLGQRPLPGRQHHAQVVRFGNKLLLVSVSPAGTDTLAEITDPVEVDRLAGLCRQAGPTSVSRSFTQLLEQFAREKSGPAPDASAVESDSV